MSDTLYRRDPGTTKPDGGQVRAVWGWLMLCRLRHPAQPAYEGAMNAAEWVIGLSNVPPVTARTWRRPEHLVELAFTPADEAERVGDRRVRPATLHRIADEINAAAEVVEASPDQDRRAYAFGAHAFLMWWAGVEDLPRELIPDPAQLIPRQAGAA